MELRPYQERAVASALAAFDAGERSTLIVHPTGTGKTVTFGAVARDFADRRKKVLVLAHRGELLEQAGKALEAFGLSAATEKASERANPYSLYDDAVLASVQTLQGDRLAGWPKDAFGLIVCDEAHHFLAPSFRSILEHFAPARVLGVTATPERGDGDRLGAVFPHLADEYPLRQAITDGYLCRIRVERPSTHVDLSKIRTTAGDLNQGDLEDEIGCWIEELVNSARERIGDRPTIVFTPDVGCAEAFADGLRQVGVTARSVSGASADRAETVAGFKRGEFQAICNCQLLTEGFDHPPASAVVLARPTKSGVLYRQMVGRGTRLSPGKVDCLVVDYAWNSGRHDLVSAVELFDTSEMDVEVQKVADELIRSGRQKDPMKAVEEAEGIHLERVALKVRVKQRESSYHFQAFDPFSIGGVFGVPERHAEGVETLTRSQRDRLAAYKIGDEGMSKAYADKLLATLDRRQKKFLATHRQVFFLVALGVPASEASGLTQKQASGRLDALLHRG